MRSFRINRANRNICPPGWRLDTQKLKWSDHALWLVHHGHGKLESGREDYPMRAGGCFFLQAGRRYIAGHDTGTRPLLAISVHFDFLDASGKSVSLPDSDLPRLHRQVDSPSFLWGIMERIAGAWRQQSESGQQESEFWLNAALKEVARQDQETVYHGVEKQRHEVIEQMCSEITDEPGAEYRVEALARRFATSRHHFARVFKEIKGVSPREFIVNARIEAAQSLLKGSSHSIKQIAELLGYKDIYFFSRQFREKAGMNPTAYRKQ